MRTRGLFVHTKGGENMTFRQKVASARRTQMAIVMGKVADAIISITIFVIFMAIAIHNG